MLVICTACRGLSGCPEDCFCSHSERYGCHDPRCGLHLPGTYVAVTDRYSMYLYPERASEKPAKTVPRRSASYRDSARVKAPSLSRTKSTASSTYSSAPRYPPSCAPPAYTSPSSSQPPPRLARHTTTSQARKTSRLSSTSRPLLAERVNGGLRRAEPATGRAAPVSSKPKPPTKSSAAPPLSRAQPRPSRPCSSKHPDCRYNYGPQATGRSYDYFDDVEDMCRDHQPGDAYSPRKSRPQPHHSYSYPDHSRSRPLAFPPSFPFEDSSKRSRPSDDTSRYARQYDNPIQKYLRLSPEEQRKARQDPLSLLDHLDKYERREFLQLFAEALQSRTRAQRNAKYQYHSTEGPDGEMLDMAATQA